MGRNCAAVPKCIAISLAKHVWNTSLLARRQRVRYTSQRPPLELGVHLLSCRALLVVQLLRRQLRVFRTTGPLSRGFSQPRIHIPRFFAVDLFPGFFGRTALRLPFLFSGFWIYVSSTQIGERFRGRDRLLLFPFLPDAFLLFSFLLRQLLGRLGAQNFVNFLVFVALLLAHSQLALVITKRLPSVHLARLFPLRGRALLLHFEILTIGLLSLPSRLLRHLMTSLPSEFFNFFSRPSRFQFRFHWRHFMIHFPRFRSHFSYRLIMSLTFPRLPLLSPRFLKINPPGLRLPQCLSRRRCLRFPCCPVPEHPRGLTLFRCQHHCRDR